MFDSHKRSRLSVALVLGMLLTVGSAMGVFVAPRPPAVATPVQSVAYSTASVVEDPVFSPDGKLLAFSSNMSGSFQIWTITLDGRHLTRLTTLAGDARDPRYSSTGRYVAFYYKEGASSAIMLVNRDGTDARRLSSGTDVGEAFQWNPDGIHIAYQEVTGNRTQTLVMDAESGVVTFRADASSPAWSDDGSLLAFVQELDGQSVLSVANMTSGLTRSVCTLTGELHYLEFSANSSSIVFIRSLNGSRQLELTQVNGCSIQNLLQPPVGGILSQSWTPILREESVPSPRPRDKTVVFAAASSPNETDLFRVVPNTQVAVSAGAFDILYPGTILDRLTLQSYSAIGVLSWNANGKSIAFSARETTGRYDLVVLSYTPPKFQSRYGA